MTAVTALVDHIDHFQRRVLADALNDATAAYWLRRAEVFMAARPRPGDYTGRASPADLRALDQRCIEAAEACRARAAVAPLNDLCDVLEVVA